MICREAEITGLPGFIPDYDGAGPMAAEHLNGRGFLR